LARPGALLFFASDDDSFEKTVSDAGARESVDFRHLQMHDAALDRGEGLGRCFGSGLPHFADEVARQLAKAFHAPIAVPGAVHLDEPPRPPRTPAVARRWRESARRRETKSDRDARRAPSPGGIRPVNWPSGRDRSLRSRDPWD